MSKVTKVTIKAEREVADKLSVVLLKDKTVKIWDKSKAANDTRIYINNLPRVFEEFGIDIYTTSNKTIAAFHEANVYYHIEKSQFVIWSDRSDIVSMFFTNLLEKFTEQA